MADVNETIILQYIMYVKGWFCIPNIPVRVDRGWSDIDILAYDPSNDRYYDIEVKFRSAATIGDNDISWLVRQFSAYRECREDTIKQYATNIKNKKTQKVVVTTHTMLGKSEEKRSRLEESFKSQMKKEGYMDPEIWYFENIIQELLDYIDIKGKYTTELFQTLRILKKYKYINLEFEE